MTVSTEVSREEYSGNGVTTDFDYLFGIFTAENIYVEVVDPQGQIATLALNPTLSLRAKWPHIKSFFEIGTEREINSKISCDALFYLSSLDVAPKRE